MKRRIESARVLRNTRITERLWWCEYEAPQMAASALPGQFAHVLCSEPDQFDPLLRRLRKVASQDFGIQHITIQMEQSVEGCTEHHHVDHLHQRERPEPEEEP